MRTIGILACAHVTGDELMQASGGADYHDMYRSLLTEAEPTLATPVYDVVNGELPASLDECQGWIITGSGRDAFTDEPWIVELRELVVELHARRSRMVGVCFGHQLIAHALGGRAGRAGQWRVGPQRLTVEPTPWFGGGTVWLNAMHQDVVHELPPGGFPIGTGTTARYPAYLVEETVFCVQDHPEFSDRYTAALIETRRVHTGDQVADRALAVAASVPTDGSTVGRWITDFLLDRRARSDG